MKASGLAKYEKTSKVKKQRTIPCTTLHPLYDSIIITVAILIITTVMTIILIVSGL